MSLRDSERGTIRGFVDAVAPYLGDRVLDYGAGLQPYADAFAAVEYVPYDRVAHACSVVSEDAGHDDILDEDFTGILCTQVLQYVEDPAALMVEFGRALTNRRGLLAMTGPTNWPVRERGDLWRFTPDGVQRLLGAAGFTDIQVASRFAIKYESEDWVVGWSVTARVQ